VTLHPLFAAEDSESLREQAAGYYTKIDIFTLHAAKPAS